jgi:hypothetical protein
MKRTIFRLSLALTTMVVAATTISGYAFTGHHWRDGSVVMHLQMGSGSGTLSDGSTSWNSVIEGALSTWNTYLSRLRFTVVRDSVVPITSTGSGDNSVFFSDTNFGRSFGSSTLAVTVTWSSTASGIASESDMVYNTAFRWDSYRGNLRAASGGGTLYDLRRVALHEEGHILGLDHPDQAGQTVSAIMNSRISNLDALTSDDIAGAQSLYGGSVLPPPPTSSAPGAPTAFTASAAGSTVSLRWTASSTGGAASSYVVEAGSVPGLTNITSFSTGNSATSFTTTGVPTGIYYVRVRASNSAGNSAASNEAALVVGAGCSAPPPAPGALQAALNTGGTVVLVWTSAAGASTYVVEAGSAPGLTNLANSDLGSTATSFTALAVPRGTYFVRVRARNTCGASAASNELVLNVS